MDILLPLILGYLLGSVPFGLVITKAAGLGDIREIGSGNIGATNVLRTGRKELALATLLLDGGKGAIAVAIAFLAGWRPEVAGAAAFLGHCFPIWLAFKGGKGVATFMGTLFALHWPAGIVRRRDLADGRKNVPLFLASRTRRGRRLAAYLFCDGQSRLRPGGAVHGGADRHPPSREYRAVAGRRRAEDRRR